MAENLIVIIPKSASVEVVVMYPDDRPGKIMASYPHLLGNAMAKAQAKAAKLEPIAYAL